MLLGHEKADSKFRFSGISGRLEEALNSATKKAISPVFAG